MTSEDCLIAMASEWLRQTYDVAEYGVPSLERLCEAVSNPAGGNNPSAAEEILYNWTSPQSIMSQEHFGYQSLPPTVTEGQQSKSIRITVDGSEYIYTLCWIVYNVVVPSAVGLLFLRHTV